MTEGYYHIFNNYKLITRGHLYNLRTVVVVGEWIPRTLGIEPSDS